jgi:hypothetical protein
MRGFSARSLVLLGALLGAASDAGATGLPGPHLEQTPGGTAPTFGPDGATFGSPGRTYLRTLYSNYAAGSFVAEITVTQVSQRSFFGLGPGERLPSFFDEPLVTPVVNFAMEGYPTDQNVHVSNNDIENVPGMNGIVVAGETDRLRLTYDQPNHRVRLEFDRNYNGTFAADATSVWIDISGDGYDATDASIFFGGAGGSVFRDLVVTSADPAGTFTEPLVPPGPVPEPATLGAASILAAAALVRRRR